MPVHAPTIVPPESMPIGAPFRGRAGVEGRVARAVVRLHACSAALAHWRAASYSAT